MNSRIWTNNTRFVHLESDNQPRQVRLFERKMCQPFKSERLQIIKLIFSKLRTPYTLSTFPHPAKSRPSPCDWSFWLSVAASSSVPEVTTAIIADLCIVLRTLYHRRYDRVVGFVQLVIPVNVLGGNSCCKHCNKARKYGRSHDEGSEASEGRWRKFKNYYL